MLGNLFKQLTSTLIELAFNLQLLTQQAKL